MAVFALLLIFANFCLLSYSAPYFSRRVDYDNQEYICNSTYLCIDTIFPDTPYPITIHCDHFNSCQNLFISPIVCTINCNSPKSCSNISSHCQCNGYCSDNNHHHRGRQLLSDSNHNDNFFTNLPDYVCM